MSSSYNTYDKVSSLDWNGDMFILTMRNEITNSFTFAYSRDGLTWTNGALSSSLTTKNPYSTKWLGDKYFISGNLVSTATDASSGSAILTNCLINMNLSNNLLGPSTQLSGNIITDGLVYYADFKNSSCYSGTGSAFYNLVDNTTQSLTGSNYSYTQANLLQLNAGNTGDTLFTTASSYTYRTVSIWYKVNQLVQDGVNNTYILDGRPVSNTYFSYSNLYGPNWAYGYRNGSLTSRSIGDGVFISSSDVGNWVNLTLVTNTNYTGVMTFFARYYDPPSARQALPCNVGAVMMYNRVLTAQENKTNYDNYYAYFNTNFSSLPQPSYSSLVTLPTGTIVYDIEKNLEYRNRIVFPKSTILAVGGSSTDSVKIAYSLDQGNSWTASSNSASVFTSSVYGSVWNGRIWVAVGTGGNTIGTSLDGNTWTGRGASVLSTTANGVDWSKQLNMFVAVGSGTNTIATSMDGIYWLGRGNTIFSAGNDVKWNGTMWVAVGTPINANNKSIAYSYDGITWSTPTQGNLFSISGIKVAWNGSLWTAIGSDAAGNNIGTSVDGVNWKIFTDASLSYTLKTLYADPTTTLIGTSSAIDGSIPAASTWSFTQNTAIGSSSFYVSCNYNGSTVFSSANTNHRLSFNSGYTFTDITSSINLNFGSPINAVNYYGNVLLVSGPSSGNNSSYSHSTNYGTSWTTRSLPGIVFEGGISSWALSQNGNIIYATTYNGGTYYSSNSGVSFTRVAISNFGNTIPTYVSVNSTASIAYISTGNENANSGLYKYTSSNSTYTKVLNVMNTYGKGSSVTDSTGNVVYVINQLVGGYTNVHISQNGGTSWTVVNSTESIIKDSAIFLGSNTLYAIFNAGASASPVKPLVTFNGLSTYTTLNPFPSYTFTNSVASSIDFSKVYIAYNTLYLYSYVAFNSQLHVIPRNSYLSRSVYSNTMPTILSTTNDGTKYLIGGSSIVTSFDTANYNGFSFTAFTNIYGMTTNNATNGTATIVPMTIACGEGNTSLAYSYDGIQWTGINNTLFTRANAAAWNGIIWVAVGTGTSSWYATSYDGIQWTSRDSTLMTEAYDIAWNGSTFIAVGIGSTPIASSVDGFTWSAVSGTSAIFTTGASAIRWTGLAWIAYGSGTNTTAISYSADGLTWAATSSRNLAITDASSGVVLSASSSSNQTSFTAENAFDGSFNASITQWKSAASKYVSSTGLYSGATSTTYNTSSTATGEWLQVQLTSSIVAKYYYMTFAVDSSNSIPYSWILLGSTDGNTWTSIDSFSYTSATYPTNNWKYPFISLPLNIYSNTTSYSYYRIVFTKSFGATFVSVADMSVFSENANSNTINVRMKPIILRDAILHPTPLLSVDGEKLNIYLMTDLSGSLIRTGYIHGSYVNNVVYGSGVNIITGSAFDGYNHIVTTTGGNVSYLSNDAAITNFNFDTSYNGTTIQSSMSTIYSACYNTQFFVLGGTGTNVITYNVLKTGAESNWYNTNANNLFTTVYGIASNSGYGMNISPNALYLSRDEKLSLVTPKSYNQYIEPETSIMFNVKPL